MTEIIIQLLTVEYVCIAMTWWDRLFL